MLYDDFIDTYYIHSQDSVLLQYPLGAKPRARPVTNRTTSNLEFWKSKTLLAAIMGAPRGCASACGCGCTASLAVNLFIITSRADYTSGGGGGVSSEVTALNLEPLYTWWNEMRVSCIEPLGYTFIEMLSAT